MLLKGNSNLRQFENFEIYKGFFVKPIKRDWVARVVFPIHILLISAASSIATFEVYG